MSEPAGNRTATPAEEPPVVSGDAVRNLVDRSERELERLVAELEVVLGEAERAERRVREHPALSMLDPADVARLVPTGSTSRESPSAQAAPPRTTVDTRPRRNGPHAGGGGAHRMQEAGREPGEQGAIEAGTDRPSGFSRLARSHWVWRAGLVLTILALLLLKIG